MWMVPQKHQCPEKRGQEATALVFVADSLEEAGLILAAQVGGLVEVEGSRGAGSVRLSGSRIRHSDVCRGLSTTMLERGL